MKKINSILLLSVAAISSCGNHEEMAQTPFERYPNSEYYNYPDHICVDSLVNEYGNPVFVFADEDSTLTFVELEDTSVIVNGYYAPGQYYTEDMKRKIMNNIKF